MTSRRVKVSESRYHPRVPDGAVYIGRPGPYLPGSPFANPYPLSRHDRAESLRLYREWLDARPQLLDRARAELTGRDLACWCPLQPELGWVGPWCHADILLELLAQPA